MKSFNGALLRSDRVRELAIFIGGGALAGLLATGPMTLTMVAMQRFFLPHHQRYALPPERIVNELGHRIGIRKQQKQPLLAVTVLMHFSYGAVMGGIYGIVSKIVGLPLPKAAQGSLFGLVVWSASYIGLLPALRLSENAPNEQTRRNILMIVSHVVWGASLGSILSLLAQRTYTSVKTS